ncbi:MAG: leucine-rich repeat protein [Clostridia bacterium]|nr:leucine-rich repeat protein [Clostridia bacterium]
MKKYICFAICLVLCCFIFASCNGDNTDSSTTVEVCQHNSVKMESISSTCFLEGRSGGYQCSLCEEILEEPTVHPKLKHNFVDDVCTHCNNQNSINQFNFELNNDGKSYKITLFYIYKSPDVLMIPEEYNGKPVTAISEEALFYSSGFEKLIIPDTITYIGRAAFYKSTDLVEVEVYGSPYFYSSAFADCMLLDEITFYGNIKEIPDRMFFGCESLNKINVPDSVTKIGKDAFTSCKQLRKIELGDNVLEIGAGAFEGTTIKELTIPKGVTVINEDTFAYAGIENIIIHDGITEIKDGAFRNCKNLESVHIGSGVVSIGKKAFYECEKLKKLTIPNNVKNLGEELVYNCVSLEEIVIGDGVEYFTGKVVTSCDNLKKITLGKGINYCSGNNVFLGCYELKELHIANLNVLASLKEAGLLENCRKAKIYHNGKIVT